jgi:cytochrome c oxidase cbb3-type subunit III
MNRIIKSLFLIIFIPIVSFAADDKDSMTILNTFILCGLLVVAFLLVIVILALLKISKILFQTAEQKAYNEAFSKQNFWEQIFHLNPISYEKQLLIDHEYDGIKELNNPTPPWFNFLFYSTILFGVLYLLAFHVVGIGKFQDEEYKEEVAIAEAKHEELLKKFANSVNENNVTQLVDKQALHEGSEIFVKNCVACHGKQGQGGVGPNLTDNFWIHGAGIKNVFKTVTIGVPQKGMIAWSKQLNPLQIQYVSSYVLSLKGTNPPNPKKAEGIEAKNDTTYAKSDTTTTALIKDSTIKN